MYIMNCMKKIAKIVGLKKKKVESPLNNMRFTFQYYYDLMNLIQSKYGFKNKVVCELGADLNLECAQAALAFGARCVYATNPDKHIRESSCKNIIVLNDSAEDLQFENNKFDLMYGLAILEHLSSPEEFARSVHRLLKKGGNAYLTGWPMWTAQEGNHVWYNTETTEYRHGVPYFDNWYHLTYPSLEKFKIHMHSNGMPEEDMDFIYEYCFQHPHISRLSPTEIIDAFKKVEGIEINVQRFYTKDLKNKYYEEARKKYSEEDLNTRGMNIYISKS